MRSVDEYNVHLLCLFAVRLLSHQRDLTEGASIALQPTTPSRHIKFF